MQNSGLPNIPAEPPAATAAPEARNPADRSHLLQLVPWVTLAIALLLTWQAWLLATAASNAEKRDYFNFQVRDTITRIEQRMQAYEQDLHGINGLFEASTTVEREEFHRYIEALHLSENYPGIQGVAFSRIVTPAEKEKHVAAMRQQGFPEYNLHPEGIRPLYTSAMYMEPLTGRNLRAFGYDMYSDPVRRQAMDMARDTGNPIMSGKVRLLQESNRQEQAGFLIYLPVYRKDVSLVNLSERRANITGWVSISFRMNDLMQGIHGDHDNGVGLTIYDGEAKENLLMYTSNASPEKGSLFQDALHSSTELAIAGHRWHLKFHAQPSMSGYLDPHRPTLIATAGILMSLLLFWLALLLVTGRERALKSAQKMNLDLIETETRLRHQSRRLAEVIWATDIGTWEWDIRSGEVILNKRWAEVLGYTLEELAPTNIKTWEQLVHPDDLNIASPMIERCLRREAKTYECEVRMHHKDGRWIWMLDRGRVVEWSPNGKPLRMSGTHQDISAHKQLEASLQLAASVFTHAREAIVITDADANIINVNETFTEITGYALEEVFGKNPRLLKSGKQDKDFYTALWQDISTRGYWSGEIWNQRKNGEIYAELLTISAVRDSAGKTQNYVGLFSDISYLKKYQQHLETIAHFDPLTGLPNRMLFADRLKLALVQSQRHGTTLGLVYIDLDGFKSVNDCHGHDVGDELLITVTQRMKAALREGDTLARIGGDEFVALLVDLTPPHNHELVVQRLLLAAAEPVSVGGCVLNVSASIGVTLHPHDACDADQLLRHADQAMYQAKQSGKNRYCLYAPATTTP